MTRNRWNKAAGVDGARLAVGVAGGLAAGTGAYLLGRLIHGKKRKGLPWLYAMLGGAGGLAGGYAMSKDWFKPLAEQKKELEQKVDAEHTAWLKQYHDFRKDMESRGYKVVMGDENDPDTWTWYNPNDSIGGKLKDLLLSEKYPNLKYQVENGINKQDLAWGAIFGGASAAHRGLNWKQNWETAKNKYLADTAHIRAQETAAADLYQKLTTEYEARVKAVGDAVGGPIGPETAAKLRASVFNEGHGWNTKTENLYRDSLKTHTPNKVWYGMKEVAHPLAWGAAGTGIARAIRYLTERASGAAEWQRIQQEAFNK